MQYIGLSLSACIPDIAAGVIPLDEVVGIRTSTAIVSPAGWDTLFATYRQTYWRHDPAGCEAIARRLLATEGILQPKLEGKSTHSIASHHWERDGVALSNDELTTMSSHHAIRTAITHEI